MEINLVWSFLMLLLQVCALHQINNSQQSSTRLIYRKKEFLSLLHLDNMVPLYLKQLLRFWNSAEETIKNTSSQTIMKVVRMVTTV